MNGTPLPFALVLLDGRTVSSVEQAGALFGGLNQDQRARLPWQVAIRMFAHAIKEPAYLKAATLSLQSALVLDRLLQTELQT